jgi:AraC-like DNA-binding protein
VIDVQVTEVVHHSGGAEYAEPATTVAVMVPQAVTSSTDRVAERRRAVALAHHFREAEGLSIAQIADRLGRSPATVKAYFYDPTGDKARTVKARHQGVCRGCGAYTQPRNGKGDAYAYCKGCHPGAIERRWPRERVLDAMRAWEGRYGRLPSSYDWSRTHATRRGAEAVERLSEGEWPAASVVTGVFGSWKLARVVAAKRLAGVDDEAGRAAGLAFVTCRTSGRDRRLGDHIARQPRPGRDSAQDFPYLDTRAGGDGG